MGRGRRGPHRVTSRQGRALITMLTLVFAVASAWTALAQVPTSPAEILANPDRFNGQLVTIHGTITNFRERLSRRGNAYYTLDLSDAKQSIRVFSFGKSPCQSGAVTVEGTFEKVKRQGRFVFYNEVTAARVTCE